MEESVKQLVSRLELNAKYLQKAFETMSQGASAALAGEILNPPLWLAVHLTEARAFLSGLLGAGCEPPWGDLAVADEDLNDPSKYPPLAQIRAAWDEASGKLMRRLEEAAVEDLSAPPPKNLPIDDGTLLGALNFFVYHETYHVGQIGAWWKKLGEGPFMT